MPKLRQCVVPAMMLALAASSSLEAQRVELPRNAAGIASLLRSSGHAGPAVRILTKVEGGHPEEALDAIADSVAAIAISLSGDDPQTVRTRHHATYVLLTAGLGRGGTPFRGAAARLFRIAEEASDIGDRGAALRAISLLPDKREAHQLLARVATSGSSVASTAVHILANDLGADGLAVVRELYRQRRVREPHAARELARVAEYYGWR